MKNIKKKKKKNTLRWVAGEEKQSSRDSYALQVTQKWTSWGEEGADIMSLGILSKEKELFKHHIGNPSPEIQHQEDEPPWLALETTVAYNSHITMYFKAG